MKQLRQPDDPDPRSILVVLPTWVGDFVMATPTLRSIRRRFVDAHITFLIEPNLRDLVRGGEWMNECIEWPAGAWSDSLRTPFLKEYRDLVWELRRRRFDWALLLPNSFRSALIARLAGVKRRIGYDRDGRGLLLTDRIRCKNRRGSSEPRPLGSGVSTPHNCGAGSGVRVGTNLPVPPGRFIPFPLVEYYADLAEAIGCDRPDDRLELFTTGDCDEVVEKRLLSLGIADRRPLVVISPGAKYGAAKCWPAERFAAVADRMIETEDAQVVVTCGPGEAPIARRIGSTMKRNGLIFDDPLLTLGQLKSLISRCDLLICNDAGPRHFAKAFEIPVVTVFGPTHPRWTATSYEAERMVRIDVDCGPCQQRVCPLKHVECMMGVSVDTVMEAARELLATRIQCTPHS